MAFELIPPRRGGIPANRYAMTDQGLSPVDVRETGVYIKGTLITPDQEAASIKRGYLEEKSEKGRLVDMTV